MTSFYHRTETCSLQTSRKSREKSKQKYLMKPTPNCLNFGRLCWCRIPLLAVKIWWFVMCDPLCSAVKYQQKLPVNTHRPRQINGNDDIFPFIIQPTMKCLFHFWKCQGGLSCDSSGELQCLASASACLQGNPDIPFQINLDRSAFINRAHCRSLIHLRGGKKTQGKMSVD